MSVEVFRDLLVRLKQVQLQVGNPQMLRGHSLFAMGIGGPKPHGIDTQRIQKKA
jgi:hypothetical protein